MAASLPSFAERYQTSAGPPTPSNGQERRFDDRLKSLEGEMTIIETRLIGDSSSA